MQRSTDVVVATDVRLYGESLEVVLQSNRWLQVGSVASTADATVEAIASVCPDILLLDPLLPDAEGLLEHVKRVRPGLKIILLGLSRAETEVVRWACLGIHGFVTRENSLEQLVAIIDEVRNGRWRCSPRVASILLRALAKQAEGRQSVEAAPVLTPREQEVGGLLARGMSNKEIASTLGIAVSTVKNHVHNILSKLGLRRRGQVGMWMREYGPRRRSRSNTAARVSD